MWKITLILFLLQHLESKNLKPLVLTPANFSAVQEQPTLVTFYAQWCPHSKRMLPELSKAALLLQDEDVLTAQLNCDKFVAFCRNLKIEGFPTTRLFKGNESVSYFGDRTAAAIYAWTRIQLHPLLRIFKNSKDADKYILSNRKTLVARVPNLGMPEYMAFKTVAGLSKTGIAHAAVVDETLSECVLEMHLVGSECDETVSDGDNPSSDKIKDNIPHNVYRYEGLWEWYSIIEYEKSASLPLLTEINAENAHNYVEAASPTLFVFLDPKDPFNEQKRQAKRKMEEIKQASREERRRRENAGKQSEPTPTAVDAPASAAESANTPYEANVTVLLHQMLADVESVSKSMRSMGNDVRNRLRVVWVDTHKYGRMAGVMGALSEAERNERRKKWVREWLSSREGGEGGERGKQENKLENSEARSKDAASTGEEAGLDATFFPFAVIAAPMSVFDAQQKKRYNLDWVTVEEEKEAQHLLTSPSVRLLPRYRSMVYFPLDIAEEMRRERERETASEQGKDKSSKDTAGKVNGQGSHSIASCLLSEDDVHYDGALFKRVLTSFITSFYNGHAAPASRSQPIPYSPSSSPSPSPSSSSFSLNQSLFDLGFFPPDIPINESVFPEVLAKEKKRRQEMLDLAIKLSEEQRARTNETDNNNKAKGGSEGQPKEGEKEASSDSSASSASSTSSATDFGTEAYPSFISRHPELPTFPFSAATSILEVVGDSFSSVVLNPRYHCVVLFHAPFSTASNDVLGAYRQVARNFIAKVKVPKPYYPLTNAPSIFAKTGKEDGANDKINESTSSSSSSSSPSNSTSKPRRPPLFVPQIPPSTIVFCTFDVSQNSAPASLGVSFSGIPSLLLFPRGINGKVNPIRCEEPYTFETIRKFIVGGTGGEEGEKEREREGEKMMRMEKKRRKVTVSGEVLGADGKARSKEDEEWVEEEEIPETMAWEGEEDTAGMSEEERKAKEEEDWRREHDMEYQMAKQKLEMEEANRAEEEERRRYEQLQQQRAKEQQKQADGNSKEAEDTNKIKDEL